MPGIRTSEGKYLEVLQPGALVNLPIEIDVYDGGNPGTMLATMEAAFDASLQVELSEVGSGRFSILRSDEKATPAILARGNLIKVKTGGVYRGSWWVEEPSETLTSTREASGEAHVLQGRGALAYLERATVYPPVWPTQPGAFRSAQHAYNGASGATTVTCGKPSGTTNGDALIAAVAFVGGSTKTIAPPSGWREFRRVNYGTTLGVAYFVKQAGSSEPASYKWAFTTTTVASVNILALYNVSLDYTTYGFASATQGSGTAIKHPSLNIGTVDGIALTFAAANAGTGMTAPTGYLEATDDAQGGARLQSSYVSPVLGDTGDVFTTNSASGGWVGAHIFIPNTASNDATFAGETPGAILATLIDRAQSRGAIGDLSYDFDGTADSQGQPWADTFDLSFHVGTSLLDVWRHLVSLGMEGECSHDLKLHAYVNRSRDKTGDVIFRKGYHFLGDVANNYHYAGLRTRFLVEGAGGRVIEVTNPTLEADPLIGRREGFLSMGTSDSATDLSRAGTTALTSSQLQDQSRTIPVDHGLLTDGRYEPWEDYRPGDYVGIDPDGTGLASAERVVAITIAQRDVLDYTVTLDLNSVTLEALVKMKRQMDAITGSGSASVGGAGSSLGLGSTPSGTTGASGTVSAASGDTPGYLYDKLDVDSPLAKVLGGVTGNRTVALSVGTGTKDGTKFLRDDGVWSVPTVPSGSFVAYNVNSNTAQAVTDGAPYYDIPGLSIANVPAGTYLAFVGITMSSKGGTVRYQLTDGSNATLWPVGSTNWNAVANSDGVLQAAFSGVITTGSTLTIKVRGAAVSSVSNYTVYSRHLTLIKVA